MCNLKKKKELFDTLLYMCIYNINDLTVKNTFLLLKILITNIENDKYDISVFSTIHKNIERHINSLEDLDFHNYMNIIFYNNINPDATFFRFIHNYIDKKDIRISSNSMLAILKIMKKYNNKDHVMFKKMARIMIDNFFNYTYDQILYVLKIFIQLNYFSQDFFNYLFKAFISSGVNDPCIPFDETYVGENKNNEIYVERDNLLHNDKTLQNNNHHYNNISHFDNEKRDIPNNILCNNILNKINNKYDNFTNDPTKSFGNTSLYINIVEEKKDDKHKKINEISHLPLHLNIIKSKMKIDSSNIIPNNMPMEDNNIYRKVTYDILYIQMHIYLFIYLGICGYRNIQALDMLSKKIQHYLYIIYNKQHDISDDNIEKKKKKNDGIKLISFSYAINKMKEDYNNNFYLLSQEHKNILLHDDMKSIQIRNNLENRELLKDKQKIGYKENYIHMCNDNIDSKKKNKKKKEKYISNVYQDDQKNIFINQLKKSCLHFVYNKNEKLDLEKLEKRKKKKKKKLKEEKNDNMNVMKYMNVENFRRSKSINTNNMNDTVYKNVSIIKKRNTEKIEQKKKTLAECYSGHPAFIRLHNRKLFRRYFNGMYKSELYLEKIKRKKTKKGNEMNKKRKGDLRLKKYRKIKTLRNMILKRYGYIFKNKYNLVSRYINDYVYNDKEKNKCLKEETFVDMILKRNEIHIDDCLFINYNILCNISMKNLMKKKFCNFISRSNEITSDEYIIQNDYYNKKQEYYKHDIIKWIYRYINNCNIFFKNNNNKKGQLINEYDIKKLDICIKEFNSDMKEEEEEEEKKKKKKNNNNKLLISLKNISLICEACTNLYYYNNNLYDVLLYHMLKIIDRFYNNIGEYVKENLICNHDKSNINMHKNFKNNNINLPGDMSIIQDRFEENIIYNNMLCDDKSDEENKILHKEINVHNNNNNNISNNNISNNNISNNNISNNNISNNNISNNYISNNNNYYYFSKLHICLFKHVWQFLICHIQIIYMMSQMCYPKNVEHIKKKFNIILYDISYLYYIYTKTLLNFQKEIEIKNRRISTDNIKHIVSNDDIHNLFSCINFYIIFLYILKKNINEQKEYFINPTTERIMESNDMMITWDDLKIEKNIHPQNNLYVHTNNIVTYEKMQELKNDDHNSIMDHHYIFKIMLHCINLIRYSNISNDKINNNEQKKKNIYIFTLIRFYYIFKTFYRNKKLLYNIIEQNYDRLLSLIYY
ncbi:hypothetical protein PFDG_04102 [Plasmodium falciparum Dd2]|uniref:Uncharacterized protein n=1 Tax=Plasmodium falciparum (isolate Dd2) TaxID=57267 RepID=A0A0L7M464_PLAF4|nr:hypothetical protein PFDG_04102 [Plasmodium falciparum Dd2]